MTRLATQKRRLLKNVNKNAAPSRPFIRRRGTERDVVMPEITMRAFRARTNQAESHAGIVATPLNADLVTAYRAQQSNRQPARRSTVIDTKRRSNLFSENATRRYNTLGDLGFSFPASLTSAFKDIGGAIKTGAESAITQIGATAVQAKQAKVANKQQAALLKQQQMIAEQDRATAEAQARTAEVMAANKPWYQDPKIMLPVAGVLGVALWAMRKKGGKRK